MSKATDGKTRATFLFVQPAGRSDGSLIGGLQNRGYECVVADSLASAVALVSTYHPALALLELPLVGGSAAAVIKELQRAEPGMKLLLAGVDSDVSSAGEAFDLG